MIVALLGLALTLTCPGPARADGEAAAPPRLVLIPGDREPAAGRVAPKPEELAALERAVRARPRDRKARFALVRGQMNLGRWPEALDAARAWRAVDAYNLVVVRLLGDLHAELGDPARARRTYSAVVELLPQDPLAQRALASVLKQSGQLAAAHQRLEAAARLRPKDARIAFELADTAQRLGRAGEAQRRFAAIIAAPETPGQVRYPAKQRVAQLLAARRLAARRAGRTEEAARLEGQLQGLGVKGGVDNDLKIYLTWDTDRTDVDLWVINPAGQKVNYQRKKGKFGGALFDDVTSGYGPESFTARRAHRGTYLVQVNYYSTRRSAFPEARGEVVVLLGEGTAGERRHVLPYRLHAPKQTVTVARIQAR